MNPNIALSPVSREDHGVHLWTSYEVKANLDHAKASNQLQLGWRNQLWHSRASELQRWLRKATTYGGPLVWMKVTATCFQKTDFSSENSSCCLPEDPKVYFRQLQCCEYVRLWSTAGAVTQWDCLSASVRPWASCRNKALSVFAFQKVQEMRYVWICSTKFVLDLWREHLIRAAGSITPAQKQFFSCVSWK